jgi:hypothetical protein
MRRIYILKKFNHLILKQQANEYFTERTNKAKTANNERAAQAKINKTSMSST